MKSIVGKSVSKEKKKSSITSQSGPSPMGSKSSKNKDKRGEATSTTEADGTANWNCAPTKKRFGTGVMKKIFGGPKLKLENKSRGHESPPQSSPDASPQQVSSDENNGHKQEMEEVIATTPSKASITHSDYETASEDGNRGETNNTKEDTSSPRLKNDTSSPPVATNPPPPKSPTSYENEPYPTKKLTGKREASLRKMLARENSRPKKRSTSGVNKGSFEDPEITRSYNAVPVLEHTKLPRGGVSVETQAVGRVQFGIPPETIKDSMLMGLSVPTVYIVPVERFCREMGPALGVNLAEFEFPAYFNFFVQRRRCTLIVDSEDAETNIRRVFGETLLGPAQFRREENPIAYEEEDFAPDFPREAIPDFQKELRYFRIMPNGKELVIETLLNFQHFEGPGESGIHDKLGFPAPVKGGDTNHEHSDDEDIDEEIKYASMAMGGEEEKEEDRSASMRADVLQKESDDEMNTDAYKTKTWAYSEAKRIGDVAFAFPPEATPDQIQNRTSKRVEIFKLPGGTEYILHDVDENNLIVGKARFSGHVRVSEGMKVAGFQTLDDSKPSSAVVEVPKPILPPSFHPPSFGVTVLGNSHGFDKSGSVSGYVLWVNGRGVMIDPPPYSSASLEREGIRPRTIVGIILTHCHADHDAGAFQKVLTGSPVVVITTPTIYKSFIRKYAALSALSPALLRHSHRHKPAIIGQPLRFQGATFHFTYTLHTIPCVGFRVDWRGRSMVFTGDHFNSPPAIEKLQETGVLSKARADDLTNLPLQETDLLLHEAGAPPIHTPLEVLQNLPQKVKRHLYVVHTSALPEGCELRVAPTGTAGTIRLDQFRSTPEQEEKRERTTRSSAYQLFQPAMSVSEDAELEYRQFSFGDSKSQSFTNRSKKGKFGSSILENSNDSAGPPLVSLRPTSSTDAWFILNLLSAVPFLTSLSYKTTMEVLETARVDAYCTNDIVIPASRRKDLLCVVWEGTCVEREKDAAKIVQPAKEQRKRADPRRPSTVIPSTGTYAPITEKELTNKKRPVTVWHAGDWTGPRSLQPERRLSGENSTSKTHDIVAVSSEGVKMITIEFASLHNILKNGSPLYRKYLIRKSQQLNNFEDFRRPSIDEANPTSLMQSKSVRNLNLIELFESNSAMRKLSAVQKRHLESLAEGPVHFTPGQRLWRSGATVDKAFIMVAGTAAFVPKRRNAGSVGLPSGNLRNKEDPYGDDASDSSLTSHEDDAVANFEGMHHVPGLEAPADTSDFSRLAKSLQKRADVIHKPPPAKQRKSWSSEEHDHDHDHDHDTVDHHSHCDSHHDEDQKHVDMDHSADFDHSLDFGLGSSFRKKPKKKRNSSRDRHANKVLGRLYSRRAFTSGLVFSRGHFLGDVSKMVAGLLSDEYKNESDEDASVNDDGSFQYGFGDKNEGADGVDESIRKLTIHEREGDEHVVHNSTLAAGKDGCVVIYFPKSSLIPFLDEYPGLLLSLLGTQVVV